MAPDTALHFSVLGPLVVARGDAAIDLGHPKQRAVLAVLIMHANSPRTADRMIDDLWGERAPRSGVGTLQSYVANLRRVLEPERRVRTAATVLTSTNGGYQLDARPETLDHVRFESAVEHASELTDSDPDRARQMLVGALNLWRGPAYADFQYEAFAESEISRLEDLRNTATEMRIACDLALGRAADLVPELDALVKQHPTRERLRLHQMLALYRAGRQTDSLASYRTYSDELRENLGLVPSPELSELHLAVLDHDPKLIVQPPARSRPNATPADTRSPPPHLVGRDEEHQLVRVALADAAGGAGSILLIEGEAGIGKNRLLERLSHEARSSGTIAAFARCVEVGGTPPFWPWAQLVRQLDPDDVASAAGAYSVHLGPLLPPDPLRQSDNQSSLFSVAEGLAAAFRTLGSESPVMLFLDDLYSSDPDSLSLLTLIGAELDRLPIVIVGTHRGADLGTSHPLTTALEHLARFDRVRRHTMRRFGLAEVSEIVTNVAGDGVDASVVKAIHDRTDGNAFFTVELTKLLATKHQLDPEGALGEVPRTVRAVIDQRIDRMSSNTVRLLQVAAIAGREFDLAAVGDVLAMPVEDSAAAVDEAIRTGLLIETDRPGVFRFAHIIVVDAVVQSLGSVRRAQLQNLVADALERPNPGSPVNWSSIAHHRVHAMAVAGVPAAITALETAGHHAMQSDALELAEQIFEQRRTLVDEHTALDAMYSVAALLDLIRVWTRKEGYHSQRITEASGALWDIVGVRRGPTQFDVSAPFTADHPVLCALQARFSNATTRADIVAADEVAARCLELAEAHPEPFMVLSANLNALVVGVAAGRVETALRTAARAEEALDVIEPDRLGLTTLPLGMQSARVSRHCFAGWAYVLAGDLARARSEYQSARRCCEQLGSAFNTGFCVAVESEAAATADSPDWVLDALEWGRADVGRGVFGLWDVWLDVLETWANGMRDGDPVAAAGRIRTCLHMMRDEGVLVVHSLFWAMTAKLERRAGRLDQALEAAQLGIRHADESGERFCHPELERLTAEVYADLGRAEDARAAQQRAETAATELGIRRCDRFDTSTAS